MVAHLGPSSSPRAVRCGCHRGPILAPPRLLPIWAHLGPSGKTDVGPMIQPTLSPFGYLAIWAPAGAHNETHLKPILGQMGTHLGPI